MMRYLMLRCIIGAALVSGCLSAKPVTYAFVVDIEKERGRPALIHSSKSTAIPSKNARSLSLWPSHISTNSNPLLDIGNIPRQPAPLLSTASYNVEPPEQKKKPFLSATKEKIQQVFPALTLPQKAKDIPKGALERKQQRSETTKEMRQAFRGLPWIIAWPGRTIAAGVGRAINKESVRAEVLLRDGEVLMNRDTSLKFALGEPISAGRILSQSSSKVNIMGKKSKRINITFQVLGSRRVGIARMTASKYGKGGIVELSVNVDGRTYAVA